MRPASPWSSPGCATSSTKGLAYSGGRNSDDDGRGDSDGVTATWLGPLVVVGFLTGLTIAAVLLRLGRLRSPASALAASALPFVFAALPVLILVAFSVIVAAWRQ